MTLWKRALLFCTLCLIPGIGQTAEQDQTIAALEALARKGSARAQFELAQKLEHAEGTTQDPDRAIHLYCEAARQGYADAQYNLGWMYLNGRGVVTDDRQAVAWLREAAKRGHGHAPVVLSKLSTITPARTPKCPVPKTIGPVVAHLKPPAKIVKMVQELAPEYGLDPALVLAVIAAESSFRADAVSANNAQGLMQLIPATAERFGVDDPFDPRQNIKGGMKYLRWLMALFQGDVALVLAAYNAGEGAVMRYGGIPPFAETRSYIAKIRKLYNAKRHPYEPTLAKAAAIFAGPEVAELE